MEQRVAALEAEIAVMKAIVPRIERKIDDFMHETHESRRHTSEKLDQIAENLSARENQAKGAAWVANLFIGGLGMLGGAIGYFLAKALPFLSRFG